MFDFGCSSNFGPYRVQHTSLDFLVVLHIILRLWKLFDLFSMLLKVPLVLFVFFGEILDYIQRFGLHLERIVDF